MPGQARLSSSGVIHLDVPGAPLARGVALPRDFSPRYGSGVRRGLSLGGGGLFFIAWQVAYLRTLQSAGVRVDDADRVVGTSAGSVVAWALAGGHLRRLHLEGYALSRLPAALSALAPATALNDSQLRALGLFERAADGGPDTVRAIGHAALAAHTPSPRTVPRNLSLLLGRERWPSPRLHVTCVDAYTGDRCVVTEQAGIPVAVAAAASCAIPGVFATQAIGDRRCMDGGVSGTGIHLDLLGGASKALVLSVADGTEVADGMMTSHPDAIREEVEDLVASGTEVLFRRPAEVTPEDLMSPRSIPKALAMGRRQARQDAGLVAEFWR